MEKSSAVKNANDNFEAPLQIVYISQEAKRKRIKSYAYGLERKLGQLPGDSELAF